MPTVTSTTFPKTVAGHAYCLRPALEKRRDASEGTLPGERRGHSRRSNLPLKHPVPGCASSWLAYVLVDDIKASTDNARSLGAQVMKDVIEVPGDRNGSASSSIRRARRWACGGKMKQLILIREPATAPPPPRALQYPDRDTAIS